jgi:acetyl-CoA carboxylase carboxyltransferase component
VKKPVPPLGSADDILGLMPNDSSKPYSMKELLKHIVDGGEMTLYKEHYRQHYTCVLMLV